MKTMEDILLYLEAELAEAHELHEEAVRDMDKQQAILHLVRAATIKGILEEIKG